MTPPPARKPVARRGTRAKKLPKAARERRIFIYGVVAAVVVLGGIWLVGGLFSGSPPSDTDSAGGSGTVEPGSGLPPNTAVLFYVGEDGTSLVEHEIEIPLGDTALARARVIAERQLSAPGPPLISPFPEGTMLRAIYITPSGDAFVDLSQQVSTGHPGGSLDELFTVYALVNALTNNVPEIAAVQILIEGREVDTLAGHVDLRRPLGLNMTWVTREGDIEDDDDEDTDVVEAAEDL